MTKKTIIILLIFSLPVVFFAGLKCQSSISQFDEIGKPSLEVVCFQNDNLNDIVFLVAKHWGLTGDHSVVGLTKNYVNGGEWYPDSTKDIIWEGASFFYQKSSDTIKIFTDEVPKSIKRLNTKQTIDLFRLIMLRQ